MLTCGAFKTLGWLKQQNCQQIIGVGSNVIDAKGTVVLNVWHHTHPRMISRETFVIIPPLELNMPQQSFSPATFPQISNSDLADPLYYDSQPVEGIVGVGFLGRYLKNGLHRDNRGLVAQCSDFGWIIFGGLVAGDEERPTAFTVITMSELYSQIHKLWEIEELEERPALSMDERACEMLYESTVVKGTDRYIVKLMLKPHIELGDSRSMAMRRFHQLEGRFKRDPELKTQYVKFMKEYEQLGHMRRADPLPPETQHYYIPHHAVAIERKFRVVFDASAKTTNGRSLNEAQYVGPRLQRDLMDIVMSFRVGQFAMSADICKMFRQIEVNQNEWDYQRILWRESTDEPIHDYWLTVVTYGMASSPYNAVKTLVKCAQDNAQEFPAAAKVTQTDFYMDDLLTAVNSREEALVLKTELNALLLRGGFELAKWRSNCREIMSGLCDPKMLAEQGCTSVLGMSWNYELDIFQFKIKENMGTGEMTKRKITSEAARIFDPQGYLAPITVRAKLCIQKLWREHTTWDEPIRSEIQSDWSQYCAQLRAAEQIPIPRWLLLTPNIPHQIHIFCDASTRAYGAAAYVRVQRPDGWKAMLLCSKSKVAPLKTVTVPRLELCAVELGSKLLSRIRAIETFAAAPAFIWTDSEIALYWLRKQPNELKTFVANRVAKVLQVVRPEQSRHIRSEENPADLVSRGVSADSLIGHGLWWNGPPMMTGDRETWPDWTGTSLSRSASEMFQLEIKRATPVGAASLPWQQAPGGSFL